MVARSVYLGLPLHVEERELRLYSERQIEISPSTHTFPSNGEVWQRTKWKKRAEEQFEELKRNIIRYERRKRIESVKVELGPKYLENLGKTKEI